MTSFHLTVIADSPEIERRWAASLQEAMDGMIKADVSLSSGSDEFGQVLFIDSQMRELERVLAGLDRRGRATFLIVPDGASVPRALLAGQVDDVLVFPFRSLDVLSKLRHYQQILAWDEVSRLNASFGDLLDRLHEDLKLAERMQKNKFPSRFPEVKGLKVSSRYLAGMRSGGDHFDLAESPDQGQLSIVMSDSSSYGLSSSVLSVLMRVAMKLSVSEVRSCGETVQRIHDELLLTLSEKDRLSLFYGVISRKDYGLRYLNLGTSCAFYAKPTEGFEQLPTQGGHIARVNSEAMSSISGTEARVVLHPQGRFALISDGYAEALGGPEKVREVLDEFRDVAPVECLNELTYRVKSQFTEPDDMPAQDCSAMILDVDAKLIRAIG